MTHPRIRERASSNVSISIAAVSRRSNLKASDVDMLALTSGCPRIAPPTAVRGVGVVLRRIRSIKMVPLASLSRDYFCPRALELQGLDGLLFVQLDGLRTASFPCTADVPS